MRCKVMGVVGMAAQRQVRAGRSQRVQRGRWGGGGLFSWDVSSVVEVVLVLAAIFLVVSNEEEVSSLIMTLFILDHLVACN